MAAQRQRAAKEAAAAASQQPEVRSNSIEPGPRYVADGKFGQARLDPVWSPQIEVTFPDATAPVGFFKEMPVPGSYDVASVCFRDSASVAVELTRDDGTSLAVYQFRQVPIGSYLFRVDGHSEVQPQTCQVHVRWKNREIGKPQRAYLGWQ